MPSFWAMLGACAGIYLFCHGFKLLQRKRLIMDTPTSKVRSAAMGLVEISGLANGPYTINAPITGVPCYYHRTVVWQWKHEGKSSSWAKVADESTHVPFYLEDSTGRVLVDPQGAELETHRDFHDEFNGGLFNDNFGGMVPNVSGFLMAHGISADARVKVEEFCIKPKNALFVLGTLAHNPGLTVSATPVRTVPPAINLVGNIPGGLFGRMFGSFNQSGAFQLGSGMITTTIDNGTSSQVTVRYNGGSAHPMSVDDQAKIAAVLTKAGISNPAAWAVAGVSPVQTAAATTRAAAAAAPAPEQFDLHPPTVLKRGDHNPAFFISWRSQREVISSLGWKSAVMIWGGPALTLLCVSILAAQFGWW
jgi:hypothetical protein